MRYVLFVVSSLILHLAGQTIQKSPDTVVIFIHGTINIKELRDKPWLFFNRKRDIDDEYVARTKKKRYSATHHEAFMSNVPGLVLIQQTDFPETTAELLASLFVESWKAAKNETQAIACYLYNWFGVLSEHIRKEAANDLYYSLAHLVQEYKMRGEQPPRLYIIGFSHGGNVALNMASTPRSGKDPAFIIDTLVLLGTPISEKRIQNAQSPFFKTIYGFVSPGDWIQAFDLSVGGLRFRTQSYLMLAEKRTVYEFTLTLLEHAKKALYSHVELGHFCWHKGPEEIKVPAIAFIPFFTEYADLLPYGQLHKGVIISSEKPEIISIGNATAKSTTVLYKDYLEKVRQYGSEHKLFPKKTQPQQPQKPIPSLVHAT